MTSSKHSFIIKEKESGSRLDVVLSEYRKMSRAKAQKCIKQGNVWVNQEEVAKSSLRVGEGDEILVHDVSNNAEKILDDKELDEVDTSRIGIIAETDEYIVIDKPAGILMHPKEDEVSKEELLKSKTIAGWLLGYNSLLWGIGEYVNRPGIVHRLDRGASGILVVAKTQEMFRYLKKQFKDRSVEKYYKVLVHGNIESEHEVLDFPIGRSKDGRMAARPKVGSVSLKNVNKIQKGREAVTEFWVEKRLINHTFLRVKLHTGRTHQIRVHLFAYDHPIVGDKLYYNKKIKGKYALDRLFLHAYRLCFSDLSGEQQCFEEDLPKELLEYLKCV